MAASERILITGASGCIGSACVRWLAEQGLSEIVGVTRTGGGSDAGPARQIRADVADALSVRNVIQEVRPTRIIHLAGLQTPDCQSYPFAGMAVNVEGTNHLWRAAAELGSDLTTAWCSPALQRSTVPAASMPEPTVREDAGLRPPNLYGHWKVAGEGATQAFHLETGVPAVSLRLATTYGPGRDRGLTSAPTSAMKAIVSGRAF